MRDQHVPHVDSTGRRFLSLLVLGVVYTSSCHGSSGREGSHPALAHDVAGIVVTALAATTPAAWKTDTNYAVGARVTYNNIVYECRQAHKSRTGWEPPNVPALWQRPTPADNQPWTNQTHYTVGLRVTYQNLLYRCQQEHVSQPDWTPNVARTLWTNVPDATIVIDSSITPPDPVIDSFEDGRPRTVGAVGVPGEAPDKLVLEEISLAPMSDADLQAFNTRWGGVTLRRGVTGTGTTPPPQNTGDLGPLVRINPALAPRSQLGRLLALRNVQGTVKFSSEGAARLLAIALSDTRAIPNGLTDLDAAIPEHPDDMGGNLDANLEFPEYSASNVQLAWKYLQYKGFPPPPPGGSWTRPTLAIIDCGFDIDPSGVPGANNPDFDFFFKQVDLIQRDGTAGGRCPVPNKWHGQKTFSVAAAVVGNSSGAAGVAGTVAIPMLMRTDLSAWTVADGIRSATLRGASVINISMGQECGLLCRLFSGMETTFAGAAGFATNNGAIVVSSAGNDGTDLRNQETLPLHGEQHHLRGRDQYQSDQSRQLWRRRRYLGALPWRPHHSRS